MLVDIFKYSELGTLLTTSIKANASAAAVDSGDGGGGGGSSGGGGSGTSDSEKVHSMQPTVPKEVDGMARALSNLHRVIKYAESDEWCVYWINSCISPITYPLTPPAAPPHSR